MLRDGASDLRSTGTITVTVCPCQNGGMWAEEQKRQTGETDKPSPPDWERQAVCLSSPSNSSLLGFSSAAMLAILACASTLLGQCGFPERFVSDFIALVLCSPSLHPTGLMICCSCICLSLSLFICRCLLACLEIAAFCASVCVCRSNYANPPCGFRSVCHLGFLMNVLLHLSTKPVLMYIDEF